MVAASTPQVPQHELLQIVLLQCCCQAPFRIPKGIGSMLPMQFVQEVQAAQSLLSCCESGRPSCYDCICKIRFPVLAHLPGPRLVMSRATTVSRLVVPVCYFLALHKKKHWLVMAVCWSREM
jgi:hypothetical protein